VTVVSPSAKPIGRGVQHCPALLFTTASCKPRAREWTSACVYGAAIDRDLGIVEPRPQACRPVAFTITLFDLHPSIRSGRIDGKPDCCFRRVHINGRRRPLSRASVDVQYEDAAAMVRPRSVSDGSLGLSRADEANNFRTFQCRSTERTALFLADKGGRRGGNTLEFIDGRLSPCSSGKRLGAFGRSFFGSSARQGGLAGGDRAK